MPRPRRRCTGWRAGPRGCSAGSPLGGAAMFSYLRYNVLLQEAWVAQQLGETMSAQQLEKLEAMDEPRNIPELDRLGRLAGARLVKPEHFGAVFDARMA